MNASKILSYLKNNAFSKKGKTFHAEISILFPGILAYIDRNKFRKMYGMSSLSFSEDSVKFKESTETVLSSVPEFQRDNDKWTEKMQSSYVINCLKGLDSSPIVLYTLNDENTGCKILDGLQRLTALSKFLTEQCMNFEIDGEVITSGEMLEACRSLPRFEFDSPFQVKILRFKTELEAVDHYIEINENITHSKDDIKRAIEYRNTLIANTTTA